MTIDVQAGTPAAATGDPADKIILQISDVTKSFAAADGDSVTVAVQGMSFEVRAGEFVSIVGPSGCGKSTILNMVAGLDRATSGSVVLGGVPVTKPNSHVGFMLQKDLLLPWRTILGNVEFGLEARPISRAERRNKAQRELQRCRLEGFANHYPYQLSGGMRQRAALARTLAIEPDIILLDEPFSALDAQTKLILQNSFAQTIATSSVTTLLITHDLNEAVAMSDRVLVMSERPGRIVEEMIIDLPNRENPMSRVGTGKAAGYVEHLLASLHLAEKTL